MKYLIDGRIIEAEYALGILMAVKERGPMTRGMGPREYLNMTREALRNLSKIDIPDNDNLYEVAEDVLSAWERIGLAEKLEDNHES